jgi:GxxExxY protein
VLHHRELTERIIGLAIEVHRHSGPGLLESFYAATLCRALERWHSGTARSRITAIYKGEPCRLDFGPISWRTKPLS